MKKVWAAGLLWMALCVAATSALAQIGFAEVKKQNVNMRQSPSGKAITQLDAPRSVYVFEEKTVGEHLWCHVYTYIGKNPREGWIRGDMLRFLSEEFTDVMDVEAGSKYVLGVRADGTVAILGDDMPHMPCIDVVRSWTGVQEAVSQSVAVNALTEDGIVRAVGKFDESAGFRAAKLTGHAGFLIDEGGRFIADALGDYAQERAAWLDGFAVREIAGRDSTPYYALTTDGVIIRRPDADPYPFSARESGFDALAYTDIDMFWNHIVALRADGRVDAMGDGMYEDVLDTGDWEDVVRVEAGENFTLGLRRDGTVYFAGADKAHAAQVAAWRDVVDISAGPRFCVALMRDGSVAMAGIYSEEYFR